MPETRVLVVESEPKRPQALWSQRRGFRLVHHCPRIRFGPSGSPPTLGSFLTTFDGATGCRESTGAVSQAAVLRAA